MSILLAKNSEHLTGEHVYMIWVVRIFVALLLWPVTLACLAVWLIFIICRAIYRSRRDKKKKLVVNTTAKTARDSINRDWRLLTEEIVKTIRQHWDVLEDKFDLYVDEDDYGNRFIDSKYSKEITYFGYHVVMPVLKKMIDDGTVHTNSLGLLPAPSSVLENLYGIKYADSDATTARKYVNGVIANDEAGPMYTDDNFLHYAYQEGSDVVGIENGSNDPSDKSSLLTLNMSDSLRTDKPMKVTFLGGIVFMIFYSMYNSKPAPAKTKDTTLVADFVGNDPYKYEEYIKKLLQSRGFSVKRTRGSGDFGVDVIAKRDDKSYAIQCKLYNRTVGIKAVQEIVSGRIFYKTDYAIVVSDNAFTPAARTFARKSDVVLVHHKRLIDEIESLTPDNDEEIVQVVDSLTAGHKPARKHAPEAKKQWTTQDADELISAVIPTITNDGK